jgi:hypothetical protein
MILQCGCVFAGVDEAFRHLKKHHYKLTENEELKARQDLQHIIPLRDVSSIYLKQRELLEPIEGLPTYSGYGCKVCVYYSQQKDSIVQHMRCHSQERRREYINIKVQKLGCQPNCPYFGVKGCSVFLFFLMAGYNLLIPFAYVDDDDSQLVSGEIDTVSPDMFAFINKMEEDAAGNLMNDIKESNNTDFVRNTTDTLGLRLHVHEVMASYNIDTLSRLSKIGM